MNIALTDLLYNHSLPAQLRSLRSCKQNSINLMLVCLVNSKNQRKNEVITKELLTTLKSSLLATSSTSSSTTTSSTRTTNTNQVSTLTTISKST